MNFNIVCFVINFSFSSTLNVYRYIPISTYPHLYYNIDISTFHESRDIVFFISIVWNTVGTLQIVVE